MAIDLIERYRKEEEDSVFFYHKNVEVDFYVPDEALAVQASYSIDDPMTCEREVRALRKLAETFPVRRAVIVTYDEERTITGEGLEIEVLPVWKWLLRK